MRKVEGDVDDVPFAEGRSLGPPDRANQCREARHDVLQRRDLGIALFRGGEAQRAIDHLAAYIAAAPHSADTEAVLQMLKRARGEVTRWN